MVEFYCIKNFYSVDGEILFQKGKTYFAEERVVGGDWKFLLDEMGVDRLMGNVDDDPDWGYKLSDYLARVR